MTFKLALRAVMAHRLRFVLCTVAVVLGVAFVAGSLMFTDTLSAGLRRTFGSAADLTVTPASALERGDRNLGTSNAKPVTLSADLAHRIDEIDGVATADPQLLVGGVQVLGRDHQPLETYGVPVFGASWPHDPSTATFRLLDGTAPWGAAELALDRATAQRAGFALGDEIRVVTPTRAVTARLTATVSTGLAGLAAGAPVVAFDPATAQLLMLGEPGWTSVAVTVAPGKDVVAVQQAIARLSPDVRVRTAAQLTADNEAALNQAFGGVSGVLLMFAGIALFVSTFLIVNTFMMLVAQRTRELAMLRAVGASPSQITRTVLAEAFVIGLVGSTIGLLLGAGLVGLLRLAIELIDLDVPTAGLQVRPGTVFTSYLVGVLVTMLSAYSPARRAGAVPPMAALRDDVGLPERSMRVRLGIGVLTILVAASGYAAALQNRGLPSAVLLGLAAGICLLGVALTSPLVSRYAVWALTMPLGRRTPVLLGRQNAQRNPRRTSATASALMIALALVSGLGVVANSVKASVEKGISDAIGTADLVVTGTDGAPFSGAVAELVTKVDGVTAVGRVRTMPGRVGDHQVQVKGVDPAVLEGPIVTRVESGSLGGVVVPRNLARTLDVTVSESLVLVTQSGTFRLTVGAVVAPNRQLDAVVLPMETFRGVGGAATDSALYVDVSGDASEVRQRIIAVLREYPSVHVRDQQAYAAAERGPIDVLLAIVYLLLALAVLIAVLGIVNTLALSVVERTREIGLLRAIGMERAQLRQMIRVESVAIAVFGAVLGIGVGVLFGAGIQAVMVEDGIEVLDIPWIQLTISALVAAAVGVLAAAWPTRRAARLDVLTAITRE